MARRRIHHITIRGRTWPTVQAAAAALRVSEGLIYKALKAGTLDEVGRNRRFGGHQPMPIVIRGQAFRNARAAARHFGVTRSAIYQALSQADPDRIGLPRGRKPARATPVTFCGRSWPSMAVLSRALGHNPGYVSHALKHGRMAALTDQVMALLMREAARNSRGGITRPDHEVRGAAGWGTKAA